MAERIDFPNGRAALAEFMVGIATDVKDRINSGGYNATRTLINSIGTDITDGLATTGTLYAASHWKFLGNGRRPGKRPPIAPLVEWAKAKGIATTDAQARSIAYRVATEISKRGSLDHQLGGKNQFTEAVLFAQQGIEGVMSAFLRDIDEPVARQFTTAFTKAA